jgi:hypothetical protein
MWGANGKKSKDQRSGDNKFVNGRPDAKEIHALPGCCARSAFTYAAPWGLFLRWYLLFWDMAIAFW